MDLEAARVRIISASVVAERIAPPGLVCPSFGNGYRESSLQCRRAADVPPAKYFVDDKVVFHRTEHGYFVGIKSHETVPGIIVGIAIIQLLEARGGVDSATIQETNPVGSSISVRRLITGIVVKRVRVSVGEGEVQSVRKLLLQADLQGVIARSARRCLLRYAQIPWDSTRSRRRLRRVLWVKKMDEREHSGAARSIGKTGGVPCGGDWIALISARQFSSE